MSRLEDLQLNAAIRGILPDGLVTVVSVQWFGSEALELTYKDAAGRVANVLLYRHDEARKALGGLVFDVLGHVQFDGRPLRDLLIEAIRYGERPEVRARLTQIVPHAFDRTRLQDLLEERALVHEAMDASRVKRVREEMERAEARRLQPHYIKSFFLYSFAELLARAQEPS